MRALWLEDQTLSLRDCPEPGRPNKALIKVRLAGICGTDLELLKGYYPFAGVPGHEFVGEVAAAADASWIGQRVVGEINVVCGQCEPCLKGWPTHCEKRTALGITRPEGAFAEYTTLPLANLHRVPDAVPDEAAVFAEPLAAALEIQEQVAIKPSSRVLLVGAGRLGQLIAQTLALTGCQLDVLARHPHQKALLAQRHIPTVTEEEVQGRRWDIVIEATGSPNGFAIAQKALRPRGVLVLKSTYAGELSLRLSQLVVDEITIVGSRCGPMAPALRLLEHREIDPTPLISARYPLEKALTAFQQASQPGMLKVLLEI